MPGVPAPAIQAQNSHSKRFVNVNVPDSFWRLKTRMRNPNRRLLASSRERRRRRLHLYLYVDIGIAENSWTLLDIARNLQESPLISSKPSSEIYAIKQKTYALLYRWLFRCQCGKHLYIANHNKMSLLLNSKVRHHHFITMIHQPVMTLLNVVFFSFKSHTRPRPLPEWPLEPRWPKSTKFPVNNGAYFERIRINNDVVLAKIVVAKHIISFPIPRLPATVGFPLSARH